jgi:acetoin utilization deacetylase AcuC-like enzyme
MRLSFHPIYEASLPGAHPVPMTMYASLKERLCEEGVIRSEDLMQPEPLDAQTAGRIHTADYLAKLDRGSLSAEERRRLGLPWSSALWLRSRLAAGGTLLAARAALAHGMAGNLAGGSHHAFADHGAGFCALNDVAIAVAQLRFEGIVKRVLIVDLDVHQGDGTAEIFDCCPDVFTFSMHAEDNYPAFKARSSLDVGLRQHTGDAEYLDLLTELLPRVLDRSDPDIAFYVAGVDVAAGDRFGKLALSDSGIREREQRVIAAIRGRGVPLVIVLGGGYASTPDRTAALHAHVFREAVAFERCACR